MFTSSFCIYCETATGHKILKNLKNIRTENETFQRLIIFNRKIISLMLNLDNVEKKIAFNQKRPDDKWIMWIGIRLMIVLFCKEYFGTINMNA